MANELVRGVARRIAVKGPTAIKKSAKKSVKKSAKKAAKHAAKKHAAKKHSAKHANHNPQDHSQGLAGKHSVDEQLQRAFHHLQRASAVISLIEPTSGGDLKVLLHHGVERYREALSLRRPEQRQISLALGLLRAAEHLAMAGLYAARGVHRLNITEPAADEIDDLADRITACAANVKSTDAYGLRLRETVYELVKRAIAAGDDPHLAWELLMGAESICAALEAGVE